MFVKFFSIIELYIYCINVFVTTIMIIIETHVTQRKLDMSLKVYIKTLKNVTREYSYEYTVKIYDLQCYIKITSAKNSHLSSKYRNNECIQVSDTRDLPNVF